MKREEIKVALIGLGYVGLPLAVEFSKKYTTIGFDINKQRIQELRNNSDKTLEISTEELTAVSKASYNDLLKSKNGLWVTDEINEIATCNFFIVTVPTPTDKYNRPVLTPLIKASETVAAVLKKGDIVVYESTVYPGVTEEECVPILEMTSGLKFNINFFVGYSPERINPGDKEHTVAKILKITSGSTSEVADFIDEVYKSVIIAGTFKASSIKVAEAAKVIENSQRDINIAFVNELSKIFTLLKIDTQEVLEAAGTKWNFLKFKPGLVGGHCIGVDPYYLAQKAQELGYHPEIILAGRRMNDSMGKYVSSEFVKLMLKKSISVVGANVLILGFTFKENCPDIRNTRVIDIYDELKTYDINIDVYDPWANVSEVSHEYGISVLSEINEKDILENYSGVILAVAHDKFIDYKLSTSDRKVIYDVKGVLDISKIDARL
jgi:UDP-N-acetyl-D-galactosamine dehydrogenase